MLGIERSSYGPTVGLCIGPYGGPRWGGLCNQLSEWEQVLFFESLDLCHRTLDFGELPCKSREVKTAVCSGWQGPIFITLLESYTDNRRITPNLWVPPIVRAPYNTASGRDCVKSLRSCLHGTCPRRTPT